MTNQTEGSPLVSIIIPIHNGASFIPKCLQSVQGQTYSNLEIICVVNGSTDRSQEMIENYAASDQRIVLISSDIGDLGHASNLGLDAAKGDYISFVDVDDWVTADYIEKLLSGLQQGYLICKSNLIHYHGETEQSRAYQGKSSGEVSIRQASWLYPQRNGAIYDKSLFEQFHYLENTYFEDLAAWPILVAKAGKIYYIDQPLYIYNRTNQNSIMNDRSDKQLVMDKVFDFIFSHVTEDMDREVNLLITALFIQAFWTSNVANIPNNDTGRAYLKRLKETVKDKLVGYYYMVDRMDLPDQAKQAMITFYKS